MKMRKLALVLAGVFLLAMPSASQAQEPILNVCDFPITVETSRDKGFFHELPGVANAPFLASITGQLFVVITNVETGRSIEVNVSGPAFLTENGAVLSGASLFFFPSPPLEVTGDIPVGLILTAGPVLVTGDENTVHTELLGGTIRADLCDALADP
jgi:hypothetical protein